MNLDPIEDIQMPRKKRTVKSLEASFHILLDIDLPVIIVQNMLFKVTL